MSAKQLQEINFLIEVINECTKKKGIKIFKDRDLNYIVECLEEIKKL